MTVRIRRASATRGYRHLIRRLAPADPFAPGPRFAPEADAPPGRFVGTGVALLAGGDTPAQAQISAEAFVYLLGTAAGRVGGHAITGFDIAFSVPKSVSIAWALADDTTRQLIYSAHLTAIDHTLAYAERAIFASRSGDARRIAGVIGAAFDHWESRTGDPQLHTHVVVPTRAQLDDGSWGVIEGAGLGEELAALDELHEGILSDVLAARLGWAFVAQRRLHCDMLRYEVDGVDPSLIRAFSTSSARIQAATNALIDEQRGGTGNPPAVREIHRLRHVAARNTRPVRVHRSLRQMTEDWRDRGGALVGRPEQWVDGLRDRCTAPAVRAGEVDQVQVEAVARRALTAVYGRRGEVTAARLAAEARRQLRTVRFATPGDRVAIADRVHAAVTQSAVFAA